ncbi:hypothetical protein [Bradyrhizobium sp. CCGUVB23]|uniref:hypothetical protein n=1 Tax=Bradyrhizobium sp. CCGUVB23 TaxID=2949630 RepID=UPI003532268C
MQFSRIMSPVNDLEVWSASSRGFSFVISFDSRTGPGLHGRPGYLASWRPIHPNRPAIKLIGSPFKTLTEAEEACQAFLKYLTGCYIGPTNEPVNQIEAIRRLIQIGLEGKVEIIQRPP